MSDNTKFSLQAGKDPHKGDARPTQIRQYRTATKTVSAPFPIALGAIKLGRVNGFQARKHSENKEFQKMYDGVLASYKRIKDAPKIDFTKDESLQLFDMVANLKKIVPEGAEVIIQEDYNNTWHLTVLREVNWNYGWASFPVGKILKVLRREDDLLHAIFLDFIKTFSCYSGVDLWFHGLLGEEIERMDERLINLQEEEGDGSKTVKEFYNAIQLYNRGLPHQYEQELKYMGPVADIEWFIGAVEGYKKHPIAKIIREGVEVLRHKKRVTDYQIYHRDKEESFYLPLDLEFCIAWSLTDALACEAEATLDSYAQEGVEEPVQFSAIDEGVKVNDFNQFKKEDTFISDLQRFFDRTWLTINKIKKYAE